MRVLLTNSGLRCNHRFTMKQSKNIFFGIIFGVVVTVLSVLIPQSIQSSEHLQEVRFGFPFSFIEQDLSAKSYSLPVSVIISSPWENPTDIRGTSLLGSWFFWSAAGLLVFMLFNRVSKKEKRSGQKTAPLERGSESSTAS